MEALHHPPVRRVVVAEDDSEMRSLLAYALDREGFEVTAVCDGLELMRVINSSRQAGTPVAAFDLVVSDVLMPGRTGLEVLAILFRMKVDTPVVLITAFGDEHTHDEAQRLGVAAMLDKPIDLSVLRRLATVLVPTRPALAD